MDLSFEDHFGNWKLNNIQLLIYKQLLTCDICIISLKIERDHEEPLNCSEL